MSETTNIKLFKHDNPSTNTNQFDVEKSLNENWDKIDTAIGNIKENINSNDTDITDLKSRVTDLETNLDTAQNNIDEIKQEQITQNKAMEANTTAIEENAESIEQNTTDITKLQLENAMLKAQIPKGTATGEEINLQDSAEMTLVDFSLEGNSKQDTREGYNLVKASNKFRKGYAGSGITGSVTDEGYLQVVAEEGNANFINSFWSLNSQNSMAKVKEILKAGDTFTIAFTIKRTEGTSAAPRVYIKENTSYKGMTGTVTTEFKQVYYNGVWEEGNDISIIHLGFASLTGTFIIKDWLVKKGDLADWEDYGASPSLDYPSEVQAVGDSGSVEIVKSNKNLLKLNNYSKTLNAINIDITKGNHIKIVGTATNNTTFYLLGNNQNMEILNRINKISNGKNIILQKTPTESPHFEIIATTDTNNYYLQINEKKSAASKMTNGEIKILKLFIPPNINFNYEFDLQFEISNQATDIVQPKENTYNLAIQKPFYKIGDYADGFIKQNNKWYEQHYIKEVIFNGTESWQLSLNQFRTFYRNIYNTSNGIANINDAATNYFKYQYTPREDIQAFDLANLNVTKNYAAFRVCVSNSSEIITVEEWKAKLQELNTQGNPLKLYYVLNTPELIECTEEQIQVLEQIIEDGTYKGVTHYFTEDEVKPTLELKYYRDLETIINKQEQLESTLNNVQAQILELGG